ncbi:MAG: hypothetical protein GEU68_03345 [Actinobacteria bacterium]|nr:hypothetical protein [Actinomycetota bacterium]
MKRVACLAASFLVVFWASSGPAAAQSLSGLDGPLDEVVGELSNPLDKVKKPVDEVVEDVEKVLDPVTKPVENITKEVDEVVDEVAKEVTEVAKNSGGSAGSVDDTPAPGPAPDSVAPPARSTPASSSTGSSDADDRVAGTTNRAGRTSNRSGRASKGGRGGPEGDTEEVAAAGNTIEPAQVKGTQIIAPATEAEESEGSGLSRTGVQVLTWLILACLLLGAGYAFVWRGRARVRAAGS